MSSNWNKNSFKKIILIASSLFLISVLFGQGCGKHSSQTSNSVDDLGSSGPETIEVIPNTKTVSMSYARQIVDSMVSCTGIKQATVSINNIHSSRKGSLSQFGDALEISAPMLMASISIAGEVCNKLILDEMPLPPAQRRIFTSVDFNSSPRNLASVDIADTARRIARSCWARDESTDELNLLLSTLNESFGSSDSTKSAMLMLCTGMLSSLSGIEI